MTSPYSCHRSSFQLSEKRGIEIPKALRLLPQKRDRDSLAQLDAGWPANIRTSWMRAAANYADPTFRLPFD